MKIHFYINQDNFDKLDKLIKSPIIDTYQRHDDIFIFHGVPLHIVPQHRNKYFNVSISLEEYLRVQDYLKYIIHDIV